MRTPFKRSAIVVALAAGALAAGVVTVVREPGLLPDWPRSPPRELHTVEKVVDGDTIDVADENGTVVRVRMLGVDAPDVGHTGERSECGAEEATVFLSEQLPAGTPVYLVSDLEAGTEDRDGRLLRYVEIEDSTDIGRLVLSEGYGTNWNRRYGPSFDRSEDYLQTVVTALDHDEGLWPTCNLNPEDPKAPVV